MIARHSVHRIRPEGLGNEPSDEQVVLNVLGGKIEEFNVLMRRHNQRLYRVCRSIVRNDAEAEEAVQEAYVRSYRHLDQFRGESKFSTWLTKIAIYEALSRRRRQSRLVPLETGTEPRAHLRPQLVSKQLGPELEAINQDLGRQLEKAIDSLPPSYRTVFVMRHVEGLSTDETAASLMISHETVKTRLLRSRRMLQERLRSRVESVPAEHVFPFLGARCADLIDRVMKRVTESAG
jgi:RNA polymerase sigma-70 factor (ECF subfamily)